MTARDEFIQSLKEDFQVQDTPLSDLINQFMMEGTSLQSPICVLAMDEKTEKHMKDFREHSEKIQEVTKDLAKPIKKAIESELAQMDDCMLSAVYEGSNATFDIMANFFSGQTLAPFLRELADQVEQKEKSEKEVRH